MSQEEIIERIERYEADVAFFKRQADEMLMLADREQRKADALKQELENLKLKTTPQ